MALVDPRDMLNNFRFHVYAQNSLFIGENGNGFFLDILSTRTTDIRVHRAGSQLKSSWIFCRDHIVNTLKIFSGMAKIVLL